MDAHVALEESAPSPVEELVEARFAFTDPRGRVTRWGEGAEDLFGIPAEQVVGQPLFEVALAGADGGWQRFLTEEGGQSPSSRLEVSVSRADGQVFPCVVHLVPVLLADGLDFSQFAADLGLDQGDSLDAFRERHQRVLGMIGAAAREGAHYAEGERLAGLIATFRPAGDMPVTTEERIDEALTRAERAEREVEDLRDPLTRVSAEFAELRAGLEGVRDRIEALEVRAAEESDLQAGVTALETSLGERVAALEGRPVVDLDADALATEIERRLAERLELALEQRIQELLPSRLEQALAGRVEADREGEPDEALAARIEEAVAARVERTVATRLQDALEEIREARAEAEQMAHDLLARRRSAPGPQPVGFYAADGGPSAPDRPPVPDFDDVSTPLAMIALNGRFTHLNPAFRKLVGYTEEEFSNARWPSPAFSEHLGSQRELRRALAAGEIEEHHLETAYMHREGLLIPLAGRMALVRDEEGVPDHLLFSVGAP